MLLPIIGGLLLLIGLLGLTADVIIRQSFDPIYYLEQSIFLICLLISFVIAPFIWFNC